MSWLRRLGFVPGLLQRQPTGIRLFHEQRSRAMIDKLKANHSARSRAQPVKQAAHPTRASCLGPSISPDERNGSMRTRREAERKVSPELWLHRFRTAQVAAESA